MAVVTMRGEPVTFLGDVVTLGGGTVPTLPIRPKKLPTVCATFPNGSPPANLLHDPGDQLGPMLTIPSYGMQALHIHAAGRGITLETTGRGRSYDQQVSLFLERMTPMFDSMVNVPEDSRVVKYTDTDRHPQLIAGKRWYKRKGVAACASPGTSNHGWYCADDLSEERDTDPQTDSLSSTTLDYLVEWAPKFGWTWELQSEPWHVTWASGDVLPPLAVQVLTAAGVPIVGSEPPTTEDDMPTPKIRRLFDSRQLGGKVTPGQVVTLDTNETGTVVVVNLTAVDVDGPGFLTAWGAGPQPGTSNVNYIEPRQTVANLAFVPLDGENIRFTVDVSAAHVIVDLQAVFK